MPRSLDELTDDIHALSRENQIALLERLTLIVEQGDAPSYNQEPPPGIMTEDDPGYEEMIKRRVEEIRNGTAKTIPWEEVKNKIEARRKARGA